MRKKLISVITCLALILSLNVTAFAAEVPNADKELVQTEQSVAMPRTISGYGHVAGVKNNGGTFYVNVTKTSGNGYGLTLKSYGSGTAQISVIKPDGTYVRFGGTWSTSVTLNNKDEVQFNLSGAQGGTWKVVYYVMGGYMDIHCHIYG